jgi:hypothetical protein
MDGGTGCSAGRMSPRLDHAAGASSAMASSLGHACTHYTIHVTVLIRADPPGVVLPG